MSRKNNDTLSDSDSDLERVIDLKSLKLNSGDLENINEFLF